MTFTKKAKKDLLSLEKPLAERILQRLEKASENPQNCFEKLEGKAYFKLRVGNYRVIAVLDFQSKNLEIRRLGHRKNIYEKI